VQAADNFRVVREVFSLHEFLDAAIILLSRLQLLGFRHAWSITSSICAKSWPR